ncbi:hypothetical protein BJ742DRAFT_781053 [Cladochytrium replicatum]|nr:hypothetical protein BJ742DRAFT_781053 [Cladochytrium replicatum]
MSAAQQFYSRIHGVHQAIRSTMVSLLEQNPTIHAAADVKPLLANVDNFHSFLVNHHRQEDVYLFPVLSRQRPIPGLTSIDVPTGPRLDFKRFSNDHVRLHTLLDELESWSSETRRSVNMPRTVVENYPAKLSEIIMQIQTLLLPHLKGEEDLCSPENIVKYFSNRELNAIMDDLDEMMKTGRRP